MTHMRELGALRKEIKAKGGGAKVAIVLRGLSARLIRKYLSEVGGERQSQNRFRGDGWRAKIEQLDEVVLTEAFSLPRFRVSFVGKKEKLERVIPEFQLLTLRFAG